MAVVNTTYNFNQPNMNFGQALLYGAFGSLTGGYGMGGSLFSMMGMGMGGYGCGYGIGGYCSDSMYAAQAGILASQTILGGISMYLQGRGGNSKVEDKPKTKEDYKKEAEEKIGADEDKKIEKAKENDTTIKGVSKNIVDGYAKLKEYNETLAKETELNILKKETDIAKYNLEQAGKQLDVLKNATPKDDLKILEKEKEFYELQEKYNAALKAQDELDKQIKIAREKKPTLEQDLKEMIGNVNKILPDLEIDESTTQTEIDKAADKLVTDAEKAKTEAIDKLAKELKETDEAEAKKRADRAKLEDKINDVDGNSASRTRASKVKEKYNNSKNYDENDLQGALAGYRKNPDDSDAWAKILKDIILSGKVKIKSGYKEVLKSIPEIKSDAKCMEELDK